MAIAFEIHGDPEFLDSLYNQFDSLHSLFMKDFGRTVGAKDFFRFLQFLVPSSIGDTPIRSLKTADRP
jgi:hypothetical protein